MFWWIFSLLFVVAGIMKSNDTYLIVAGIFALAASIGELGWKIRCAADTIYKAIYDEDELGNG